ncbi:hypothetical protein [uncultured Thiodictyon sp.]|uniref:hypothetical protein n=1 Tax=uncultured Thiodictyon sp. TaxID=1846217 RepID=UPI0025FC9747|nr:hypothetical protein [uncultured Thiodictyon sp.]
MSAIFPNWAPSPLVEIHSAIAENIASHDKNMNPIFDRDRGRQALLERLLLEPKMRRAWSEVLKRVKVAGNPSGIIFFEAVHALENAGRTQKTRVDEAQEYQAIAKAAREFGRLLYGSLFDTSPSRWFPDDVISGFLGMMRPELATNAFCPMDPPPGVEKGTVYDGNPLTSLGGENVFLPITIDEGIGGFFEALAPKCPDMASIVFAIAEEADRNAKEAMSRQRTLPKPGVGNARRLVFIREFGGSIKFLCGGYLKRTLALFATAALQEEVTADQVSDALRDFDPTPYRHWSYAQDRPRARYIHWNDPRVKN